MLGSSPHQKKKKDKCPFFIFLIVMLIFSYLLEHILRSLGVLAFHHIGCIYFSLSLFHFLLFQSYGKVTFQEKLPQPVLSCRIPYN